MKKTAIWLSVILFALGHLSCTKDPQAPVHHKEDPSIPIVPSDSLQVLPYVQSFISDFGTYMTYNVSGDQSWKIDYNSANITGSNSGTNYINEDWLISSPVTLSGVNDAKMTIEYIGRYFDDINEDVTIWVSTNYTWGNAPSTATWTRLPAELVQGTNWTDFLSVEIALTQFVGQTVTLAVKYVSDVSNAGWLEIQSITIEEGSTVINQFFNVQVFANPTNGGIVTGSGTYLQGQTCTVMASANNGYFFNNWTENGIQVSNNANYTFTVADNRTLVANFGLVSGEGSGTFDDPYNVTMGIALQSEEPTAWVHGYIVGAVKSGITSVTSNSDINWNGSFDLATNVVIADYAACNEISQCIIVHLPAGTLLRTQVNLMDHPGNLGKHLAVLGKLRSYYGQAGLRDSGGTEDDFSLDGSHTPVGEIYSETFATGQGSFTIQDVTLPSGLTYVWVHSSNTLCMKASAFYYNESFASESWLVSPNIDLSGVNSAKLTFDQAVNYASPDGVLFVMISTDYNGDVTTARWTELNLDQWPAGNDWIFNTSTVDLAPYVGQTVTIAFKYTSTTSVNPSWEVKNFAVME